jgi:hypothetical protein
VKSNFHVTKKADKKIHTVNFYLRLIRAYLYYACSMAVAAVLIVIWVSRERQYPQLFYQPFLDELFPTLVLVEVVAPLLLAILSVRSND